MTSKKFILLSLTLTMGNIDTSKAAFAEEKNRRSLGNVFLSFSDPSKFLSLTKFFFFVIGQKIVLSSAKIFFVIGQKKFWHQQKDLFLIGQKKVFSLAKIFFFYWLKLFLNGHNFFLSSAKNFFCYWPKKFFDVGQKFFFVIR